MFLADHDQVLPHGAVIPGQGVACLLLSAKYRDAESWRRCPKSSFIVSDLVIRLPMGCARDRVHKQHHAASRVSFCVVHAWPKCKKRSVSIYFVKSPLAAVLARGIDLASLLADADISPTALQAPLGHVPSSFSALWLSVAKVLDDELFG